MTTRSQNNGQAKRLPLWARYAIAVLAQAPFFALLKAIDPYVPLGDYPIIYAVMLMAVVYLLGEGPAIPVFAIDLLLFLRYFLLPRGGLAAPEHVSGWATLLAYALGVGVVAFASAMIIRGKRRAERLAEALRESHEDLNRAQAVARIGSWRLDVRRNELFWSDQTYRMFGIPKGTPLTYEAFLATVHPDDREYVDTNWQAALGGEPYDIEHRIVVDDTVKWVRETAILEFEDEDGLLGGFGTVQDISERKQAENELRETRDYLDSLIGYANAPIIVWDPASRVTRFNRAFERLTGYSASEVVGHDLRILFPKESREESLAEIGKALSGERWESVEIPIIRKDGGVRIALWNSANIYSGDGITPVATIAQGQDITERVEFERARHETYEREHRVAEALQQALIPSQIPYAIGNWSVAARYQPALEEAQVGGDFYDVFQLGKGRFGVLIGDIAGKGLAAAIRVAAVRYAIRSYAYMDPSPARVMTLTNDALCREGADEDEMLSAFFAVVYAADDTIVYANAGHEPPVLRNARGETMELGVTGPLLGVVGGSEYSEKVFRLEPGDSIVMFTDGITEARREDALFDKDGVIEHLTRIGDASPDEIAETLLQAAAAYAGGSLQDDAAIVVLEYKE